MILAIVLLLPCLLMGFGLSLPSYYSESYYAQLPALYEKLQSTRGQKIVIVGGSNVAFGVDSALLEETLRRHGYDYTVCNFGLYAAVGTSAMLSLSEGCLGEGDVVVLAIEPTADTFSTYFGATAMLKCAEDAPGMLLHLNRSQQSAVVGNYLPYLQERAEIARTGLLPQPDGVYARASFNENGDMIYDRAGNAMLLGYDTANLIDLAALTCQPDFARQVNDYIAAAKRRGAQVVLSFSPMNRSAVADTSAETIYSFFRTLQSTFDCAVSSDPNNYLLDSGWFYDSNFHLNSAGMTLRTQQLTGDLLTWFGCSDRLDFERPEMPASIAVLPQEESNTEDFVYEAVSENGLAVCGLTEQGKTKQSLTLPASVQGKAVVAITADALGSNSVLTQLTLPATIESIPDGLFAGCTGLVRLTLLHRDSTPQVGDALLAGVPGLAVYVPQEAYHLYRDGADCAANTWEQYLENIAVFAG